MGWRCVNIGYAAREARQQQEQNEQAKPVKGPRGEFLSYITDEHMQIEDAMARIFTEYKNKYQKEDLIIWLREELRKGHFSNEVLKEIENYLENPEQNKNMRNSDEER